MRWLSLLAAVVAALSGCGLVTQSSDGASVGAPTPTEDVRAIPPSETTTTTTIPPIEIDPETGQPLVELAEGERLPMNINDTYVIGQPGNEECDAAFSLVARGVDLASLQREDPMSEYVDAFNRSILAGNFLIEVSDSPVLDAQAAGSVAYLTELLGLANSGVSVDELRTAINQWATKDGINAGTWLLGVQQECPAIVQGVVIPEFVYPPES